MATPSNVNANMMNSALIPNITGGFSMPEAKVITGVRNKINVNRRAAAEKNLFMIIFCLLFESNLLFEE